MTSELIIGPLMIMPVVLICIIGVIISIAVFVIKGVFIFKVFDWAMDDDDDDGTPIKEHKYCPYCGESFAPGNKYTRCPFCKESLKEKVE